MTTLLYDSSFEGFLSAIFEAYERRLPLFRIRKQSCYTGEMFGDTITVIPDKKHASRVLTGLRKKITATGLDYIHCASLSELPNAEDLLQNFIQHVFKHPENAERDFSNKNVLEISRLTKMVHREKHRMKAFIRFQLTKDGIYYAAIEPDFNVIPLIITHFRNRYADQRWLIYDLKRKYGVYYDLEKTETVTLDFAPGNNGGKDISISLHENEPLYQRLWQDYFKSAGITSRKNTALHLRHVPRRYWKLLTEKSPF